MNLLRKLLSLFVIFAIIGSNILNVSALNNIDYKELILSKNELSKTLKGKKYIRQIDSLIDTYKSNEKILEKLESKLVLLFQKLQNDNSLKNKELKNIINYFYFQVLINLENKAEEEINYESTLSSEEQDLVNKELVKIQLNLLENTTKWLEILINDFEKLANYEESGNFNMDFNFDQEQYWTIDASFDLQNYVTKASNFDSQISWNVNLNVDSKIKWEDEMSLNLSTFLDFISKDWNMYLLLQDFNISQENLDFFNTQIEKIKEVAKENKYIKYSDANSAQALNILKSLTPNKILSDWKTVLSNPMFEAYKKDGEKYYLKPTKYACDKVKETLNKFDPFNWSSCSEGQYENMLEDLAEVWEIYIIIWDNTTLGFEWIKTRDIDELTWSITFSDTFIEKLYFSVQPNQTYNPWEYFKIEYVKNSNLDINLYAEKWEIDYKFDSKLDRNNKFTYINYTWKTSTRYNELISNLKLENRNITWDFKNVSNKYDYETRTYSLNDVISWKISWNTNYSNQLDDLNIEYIGDNIDTWKFLDWSFVYNNEVFKFNNYFYNEYSKSNFELAATWDSRNKIITDWKILFEIFSKQWSYDYETYKYIYSWDFEKNLGLNVDIVNKNITWELSAYEGWEELFIMNSTWKYDKKYFELDNKIVFWEELINQINQTLKFMYQTEEEINIYSIICNMNMLFDTRNNQNNAKLYFDLNFDNKKVIEFNLNNDADRDYKDVKINIPNDSDVINFEEIMY